MHVLWRALSIHKNHKSDIEVIAVLLRSCCLMWFFQAATSVKVGLSYSCSTVISWARFADGVRSYPSLQFGGSTRSRCSLTFVQLLPRKTLQNFASGLCALTERSCPAPRVMLSSRPLLFVCLRCEFNVWQRCLSCLAPCSTIAIVLLHIKSNVFCWWSD